MLFMAQWMKEELSCVLTMCWLHVRRPQSFNTKCVTGDPCLPTVGYPESDTWCADLDTNTECWAKYNCSTSCYNTETPQNNYIGLRTITGENTLYGALVPSD